MFQPHFEILPPPQITLWPELAELPGHFVLYGGTALALRLGHRQSLDFDFFTSETAIPAQLLGHLKILRGAKILQNTTQTLTVSLNRAGPVKLSFFGGLQLGRVGQSDTTPDGFVKVASLLDLAATKAAVITQRAEAKDYLDLLAIIQTSEDIDLARGWCKSVSVICLSFPRLAPSGGRRSEGERSEPSAAAPRRGQGAPCAKSWSRAGHDGFLLGCRKHNQHIQPHDPPNQS
jgi:hypothetical protein